MSSENCPHCGARLPIARDAFCITCGEAVDEPPEIPRTAEAQKAFRAKIERDAKWSVLSFKWLTTLLEVTDFKQHIFDRAVADFATSEQSPTSQTTRGSPTVRKPGARISRPFLGTVLILSLVLSAVALGTLVAFSYYRGHRMYEQAKQALVENRLHEARHRLAEYCRKWPRDPDGHFLAARAARRLREFAEADTHLRRCSELGFDVDKLQLEYAMLQAQRESPDAVEGFLLAKVNEAHDDTALILEAIIQGYLKTYQLPKALHCLNLWRQRDAESLQALFWEGMIAEKLINPRAALIAFERVVAGEPDNIEARLRLADLLVGLDKDYRRASEHYERLQAADPDNLQSALGMAACYIGLSRLDEAQTTLNRIRYDHPDDTRVLSESGQLALLLGKTREAEDFLRRALDAEPSEPDAVYAYSQALHQLGRTAEAKQYEETHAAIRADLQRLDELGRLAAAEPRNAQLRYEMGVIFLRNGRDEEGIAWLKTALQVDPDHAASHQALAESFERKGMKREALEHRRR
jgi:tetratricopeptide (TPR) repeat protein